MAFSYLDTDLRLRVQRETGTERTFGTLSMLASGRWIKLCDTLEDPVRTLGADGSGKQWGKTAIGASTYVVELTFSQRFQTILPLLLNVLWFAGIRIHAGNSEADTDGCLLVGLKRAGNRLLQSRDALKLLMGILTQATSAKRRVVIEILDAVSPSSTPV